MITDIFSRRYSEYDLKIGNSFFIQLFNIYDGYDIGIHRTLLDKVQGYPYSTFADEHIRIIAQSQEKLCNELGYRNLDNLLYKDTEDTAGGFNDYRIFKNYAFDESVSSLDKISFFEILFRKAEEHLKNEIRFLENNIPKYEVKSSEIIKKSKEENANYYNEDKKKLEESIPQLVRKKNSLESMQTEINQRLKLHKLEFMYHNGYFQKSSDPILESNIATPFWNIISDPKYKNVETDILEALDRYESGGRDSALYAAKALESMMKIICDERGFTTGNEKGAANYLSHLNSSKNNTLIINYEKEELLSLFRIRNAQGHGPGSEPMPKLTNQQTLRYIHSIMVWISSIAKR